MKYRIAQHTDVGSRETNQDRCAYTMRDNSVLMVLADGLGGYDGGELAASTFCDTVIDSYDQFTQPHIADPVGFIVLATIHGHRMINRIAKEKGFEDEMNHPRTTSVVCLIQDGYAYWGHVGDSRLYLFRDGRAIRRTEDHTEAESYRRKGVISEDEMRLNENQGPLLRCIGGSKRPVVSLGKEIRLEPGDHIMMCSDGLWRAHDSDGMFELMAEDDDLQGCVEQLVISSVINMKKRSDNVTSIALRYDDEPTTAPALMPRYYTGPEQSKLWDDQWDEARRRRRRRQQIADDVSMRFEDEHLTDEIDEIDQALSELESFVGDL